MLGPNLYLLSTVVDYKYMAHLCGNEIWKTENGAGENGVRKWCQVPFFVTACMLCIDARDTNHFDVDIVLVDATAFPTAISFQYSFNTANARCYCLFLHDFEWTTLPAAAVRMNNTREFARIIHMRAAAEFYRECFFKLRVFFRRSFWPYRVYGNHVGIFCTEFLLGSKFLRLYFWNR